MSNRFKLGPTRFSSWSKNFPEKTLPTCAPLVTRACWCF